MFRPATKMTASNRIVAAQTLVASRPAVVARQASAAMATTSRVGGGSQSIQVPSAPVKADLIAPPAPPPSKSAWTNFKNNLKFTGENMVRTAKFVGHGAAVASSAALRAGTSVASGITTFSQNFGHNLNVAVVKPVAGFAKDVGNYFGNSFKSLGHFLGL
jgi:hypothetical protein